MRQHVIFLMRELVWRLFDWSYVLLLIILPYNHLRLASEKFLNDFFRKSQWKSILSFLEHFSFASENIIYIDQMPNEIMHQIQQLAVMAIVLEFRLTIWVLRKICQYSIYWRGWSWWRDDWRGICDGQSSHNHFCSTSQSKSLSDGELLLMKIRIDSEKLYKLTIKQLQFIILSCQMDKLKYSMKALYRKKSSKTN